MKTRFLTTAAAAATLVAALAGTAVGQDQTFAFLPEEGIVAYATGTKPSQLGDKDAGFVGSDWVTMSEFEEDGVNYVGLHWSVQTPPAEDGTQEVLGSFFASWEAETGRPASALQVTANADLVSPEVLDAHPGVLNNDGKIAVSFPLMSLPWYLDGANVCVDGEPYGVTVPDTQHVFKGGDSQAWSCTPLSGYTTVWTEPVDEKWGAVNAVLGNFSETLAVWRNYGMDGDGTVTAVSGLNFELQFEGHAQTVELDGTNACVGAGESANFSATTHVETQNPGDLPATQWASGDLEWTMFHGKTSPWGGNEKYVRALGEDFWTFTADGSFINGRVNGGVDLVEAGTDYVLPFEDVCAPAAEFVR